MAREKVEVQVKLDVADARKKLADAKKDSDAASAKASKMGGGAKATKMRQGGRAKVGGGKSSIGGKIGIVMVIVGLVLGTIKAVFQIVKWIAIEVGKWFPGIQKGITETIQQLNKGIAKVVTTVTSVARVASITKMAAASGMELSVSEAADVQSVVQMNQQRDFELKARATDKAGGDVTAMARGLVLGGSG